MITLLLLFAGQAAYAALRMASIHGVARGRPAIATIMDAGQNLVMMLVLAGAVSAIARDDWLSVACIVAGQATGGYLALKYLTRRTTS